MISRLVTPGNAALLDKEARDSWGLISHALVEAAGRSCAAALKKILYRRSPVHSGLILVCAGLGNNGADALVMLRSLLENNVTKGNHFSATVLLSRFPAADDTSPCAKAVKALQMMKVPVIVWNKTTAEELFSTAALIIDGIAGTGIRGILEGVPLEMVLAINKRRKSSSSSSCMVVSVDVPSGAGTNWKQGNPVICADYTLAVEPLKTVLYIPALRTYCGTIKPIRGIFPSLLLARYGDAELLDWKNQCKSIPPVLPGAYKYSRGVATIYAGKTGFAGAARIAASGAAAAGSGLVRLIVDDDLYPVLASSFGGVMVFPDSAQSAELPASDALLLGPGWGRGKERLSVLQNALEAEQLGMPLVIDADGISLLKTFATAEPEGDFPVFNGRTILTPHAGELEAFSGIPKEQLLCEPDRIAELAKKINATILFKSHVMIVADPDGRFGFIDGMEPSLGTGGTGDLLAGICAGIASRMRSLEKQGMEIFDAYAVAVAAGTLLIAASRRMGKCFYDPLELTEPAADLAGRAWLYRRNYGRK